MLKHSTNTLNSFRNRRNTFEVVNIAGTRRARAQRSRYGFKLLSFVFITPKFIVYLDLPIKEG